MGAEHGRLIDADALIYEIKECLWDWDSVDGITATTVLKQTITDIGNMPTIEPERNRGKWHITDAYPHNVYCSECNTRFAQTHWAVWEDGSLPRNFCPNCGADMRKEKKNAYTKD